MSLTEPSVAYRPFQYPWAYDFWERHENMHWLSKEVSLADDVREFKNMTPEEQSLITGIFRMFVQSEINIQNCYHRIYAKTFKPVEVQMMLGSFANRESVHISAYSMLLDTLGLPEAEYLKFLDYDEMRAKHDYLQSFNPTNPLETAVSLAGVSAFGEGVQLFASFAVLLNFPRRNLLKGMGQIISWSVRDESEHCRGIMRLFHAYLQENPEIDRAELSRRIRHECEVTIANEDKFIDLAFEAGDVQGLSANGLKQYIRYVANERMQGLGEAPIYDVRQNPLPWIDSQAVGIEHANFFERQATAYSKAATTGDWGDVF